ncbi:signal peptidase II [Desulfopila aestuarii]|uniref:Lipoprotein signal peptidase n=1 Tax=Desulfopila aestuarii DSM 18488 TaxID=1121416 RepID=A0A1M7Y1C2_9BACT|nr:signal peptidase II [Desulfopila aestuarii]SHO45558.1 signal peptidase II Aspartic peptidase. MEROPS family A08 [Desulfopila aestuarii DSM 18488]
MGYFLLVIVVIVADQLSKWWILSSFRLYESREIIPGFFNLVYVTNTGAAFSMFADVDSPWRHYFFVGVGIVAIVGLTAGYFIMRRENRWYGPAFACIAGGAAGNLIDRVRLGAVVDFFDVYIQDYHWPAFNVADSAICVGAGIFIVLSILDRPKNSTKE